MLFLAALCRFPSQEVEKSRDPLLIKQHCKDPEDSDSGVRAQVDHLPAPAVVAND